MVTIKRKPDFKKLMYENQAWENNQVVCGIDEVGRSCLAGPVVAAAAILKPYAKYKYLKDSKKLTPEERVKAYAWLMNNCEFGVGIIHHRIIDSINIHQATICAMRRAVMQLLAISKEKPSTILVDFVALKLETIETPVIHFAYGEDKSSSIAAASIIAKVTRDNLMSRMNSIMPGYAFNSNKGYGTKLHKQGIKEEGLTFCHRLSFCQERQNI